MSLFALVLVGLLSVYFWRQVVALALAAAVVLVVVGAASLVHGADPRPTAAAAVVALTS